MRCIAWTFVFLLAAAGQSVEKRELTLLTYNVLADPVGAKKRIPPLLKLLDESDADIIALQEVAPWFMKMLLAEKWVAEKSYHFTRARGKIFFPGGQLIMSKHKIERATWSILPGRQRRTVLVATLRINDRRMDVAITHMESYLEDGPVRAKQLDVIFPRLKEADDAIFLGDFNFGDGEKPDSDHLNKEYVDMWLALHKDKPGFTWNIEVSDMARKGSFPGEKSRRIDRILVRSKVWTPRSIRIIGDQPVVEGQKDLFPSDHFGLFGTLTSE
jgi:endonuclease/exonuclease/phosphatase family metal-dependent hydrolase